MYRNAIPRKLKQFEHMKELFQQYEENEDENCHAENCCLLADNFGDESEQFICNANLKYKNMFGCVDHGLSQNAYSVTKKYLDKLRG